MIAKVLSIFSGHQPLQDIEIRVGNSSVELQRNPLCAWFPGTIGKHSESCLNALSCPCLIGRFHYRGRNHENFRVREGPDRTVRVSAAGRGRG